MVKKIVSKKMGAGKLLLLLGGAMAGVKLLKPRKDSPVGENDFENDYYHETYGGDDGAVQTTTTTQHMNNKCGNKKRCKKCKCNKCCKAKETSH